MLDHKKNYCKMRFTCKCEDKEEEGSPHECRPQRAITSSPSSGEVIGYEIVIIKEYIQLSIGFHQPTSPGKRVFLRCSQCKENFKGAWDLILHVQNVHRINIYTLGEIIKVIFIYS